MKTLRIGSRKSPLALAQSQIILNLLQPYRPTELKLITTQGDKDQYSHYKNSSFSIKGFFTKEIEKALLNHEIDLAVHSCKDLQAVMPEGLCLAAFSKREDPRDIFISKSGLPFHQLPCDSVIGSSSFRREEQALALRPDLIIKPIRGNVERRIEKMYQEDYDGLILAAAGLHRLNLSSVITNYFSPDEIIPAPAQGTLALQCRTEDKEVIELCRQAVHDPQNALCVAIERNFSAVYGGGCSMPLACYAEHNGTGMRVWAMTEEKKIRRLYREFPHKDADLIVTQLVEEMRK